MKNILLLISLCLSFSHVRAEVVSIEDAQMKAQAFFQQHGTRKGAKAIHVAPIHTTRAAGTDNYYIFNREDGNGFVIISAETGTREVLAYSDEDIFHTDMPEGYTNGFLRHYDEVIGQLRKGDLPTDVRSNTPSQVTPTGRQKVLKTLDIGQDGSYFNSSYAPKYNGKYCVSGCNATAMSILMAYHAWPNVPGLGSVSYKTDTYGISLSCDFAEQESFDWDLINQGANSSKAASNETSRLLKTAGIAIYSDYTPSNTTSYSIAICQALRDVFYYDYCTYLDRAGIPNESEWDQIVINEIDQNRPVIVAGTNTTDSLDRHCYIIDGYDANGLYHYNLGWGGQNNAFYADGNIVPFNRYHCDELVYGIQPREKAEDDNIPSIFFKHVRKVIWSADPETGKEYTFDHSEVKKNQTFYVIVEYLANGMHKTMDGNLRVELRDKSDKLKAILSDPIATDLEFNWYYYWFYFQCRVPNTTTLLSTDHINIAYSEDGMNWQKLYCIDDEHSYVPVNPSANSIEVPLKLNDPAFTSYFDVQGRRLSASSSQHGLRIIHDQSGTRKVLR